MFQRIVVPLDGSARAERAIPEAVRLARASGGSIVLLRIAGIPVAYEPSLLASYVSQTLFYAEGIQEVELAKARAYLADVAQSAQLAGIKTDGKEVTSSRSRRRGEDPWVLTSHSNHGRPCS